MKTYVLIWVALLVLLVAGGAVGAAMGAEGFLEYIFVPRWRHRRRWWGPGPWPWRYPSGPRWWYVPYVEPFEGEAVAEEGGEGEGEGKEGAKVGFFKGENGKGEVGFFKEGDVGFFKEGEKPIDKVVGAPEAFDSVPSPELQKMLRTTGIMGDRNMPPLTGTVVPKEGFVNGSGYPNGVHVPPAVRYSIFSGSEIPRKPLKDNVMTFPPGAPASAEGLYNSRAPSYLLLGDELEAEPGAGSPSRISCVNSRSCFATDFDRLLEQGGNFRQTTNNYKRGYPDSCSSPYQELVLSFYKSNGPTVPLPPNCA
jgi:hypothetical protein